MSSETQFSLRLIRWNILALSLAILGALAYNLPYALMFGFEDFWLYSSGTATLFSIGGVIAATSAYWFEFCRDRRPAPDRRFAPSVKGPGLTLVLGGPLRWFYYSWGGLVTALCLSLISAIWLDWECRRRKCDSAPS